MRKERKTSKNLQLLSILAEVSLDKYFGFLHTINSESNSKSKGGIATKKREVFAENKNHKCPNSLCGKNFANPIKVENVGNGAVYEACPYCLTEIIVEKPALISTTEQEISKRERESGEKPPAKEKHTVQAVPEKTECKHYFGYLSQHSSKEDVPEECIVCEKIVQCMLKTIIE